MVFIVWVCVVVWLVSECIVLIWLVMLCSVLIIDWL